MTPDLVNLALNLCSLAQPWILVLSTTGATATVWHSVLIICTLGSHLHLTFSWWDSSTEIQVTQWWLTWESHSYTRGCKFRVDMPPDNRWVTDMCDLHLWSCQFSKICFFFFFCWLGHVQHVVPSHWALMPHRTALASFISTNVSIGRYDEALTRQSPSPPSLLILPSLENRAPSHTQPPRRGLSRFLGLWLLSCNSA